MDLYFSEGYMHISYKLNWDSNLPLTPSCYVGGVTEKKEQKHQIHIMSVLLKLPNMADWHFFLNVSCTFMCLLQQPVIVTICQLVDSVQRHMWLAVSCSQLSETVSVTSLKHSSGGGLLGVSCSVISSLYITFFGMSLSFIP